MYRLQEANNIFFYLLIYLSLLSLFYKPLLCKALAANAYVDKK